MKTLLGLMGVIALALMATAIFMRVTPMPPAIWHADPDGVTPPDSPNYVLLRAETAHPAVGDPASVAARLDQIARADGARLIAGSVEEGHMTYVQRTPLMGYPDAVSIRLSDAGEGRTSIALFSRSRFGRSDLGANQARVDRWLGRLAP